MNMLIGEVVDDIVHVHGGRALTNIREIGGLNLQEMAERLKCSASDCKQMESATDPRISAFIRYVHAVDGTIDVVAQIAQKRFSI